MQPLAIQIGPLAIQFSSVEPAWAKLLKNRYKQFITKNEFENCHTITISTLRPSAAKNRELKTSSTNLSHHINRHDFISLTDRRTLKTTLQCAPNKYSFDSWLRVFITVTGAEHNILLVHGAATNYKGKAYLFAGISGKGKSTITKKLGLKPALSDELTLLSINRAGQLFAHSTPFWGELAQPPDNKPASCPLKTIYFLSHGKRLCSMPLSPGEAFKSLLSTVLFFSVNKKTINCLIDTAMAVALSVPAAKLEFSLKDNNKDICNLLEGKAK
jgi:hypothetical protein